MLELRLELLELNVIGGTSLEALELRLKLLELDVIGGTSLDILELRLKLLELDVIGIGSLKLDKLLKLTDELSLELKDALELLLDDSVSSSSIGIGPLDTLELELTLLPDGTSSLTHT